MSRILWHATLSLDGFTTGPDDDPHWVFRRPLGEVPLAAETTARIGAILAGRRWHDQALRHPWAEVVPYGGAVTGPIFVLTHTPPATSPLPVTFLKTDLPAAIATARDAAGDKDVALFGATLATAALAAGLVDEAIFHILPIFLGRGVPAYPHPGAALDFETLEILPGKQVTTWRLKPLVRPNPAHP